MSAFPQQDTGYFPSFGRTSYIEEETRIRAVSCSGGKFCYTIGGLVGQEFSRMEKPTKREWSDEAPRWRVATGGLNLEGWCNNSSCGANRGLVIHKWGFKNSGLFNYHDNEHECSCPLCGSKLTSVCLEATDVDSGLEYLPFSLAKAVSWYDIEIIRYSHIECSPHENTNAKCKAIQDALRPYNYDLEAWQLAHPHKMHHAQPHLFEHPESREKWLNAVTAKIQKTQAKLRETKQSEPNKAKKIKRLELKIQNLELIKQLMKEKGLHQTKEMLDKATQTEESHFNQLKLETVSEKKQY